MKYIKMFEEKYYDASYSKYLKSLEYDLDELKLKYKEEMDDIDKIFKNNMEILNNVKSKEDLEEFKKINYHVQTAKFNTNNKLNGYINDKGDELMKAYYIKCKEIDSYEREKNINNLHLSHKDEIDKMGNIYNKYINELKRIETKSEMEIFITKLPKLKKEISKIDYNNMLITSGAISELYIFRRLFYDMITKFGIFFYFKLFQISI